MKEVPAVTYRERGLASETTFAIHEVKKGCHGAINLMLHFIDAETNRQDRVELNAEAVAQIVAVATHPAELDGECTPGGVLLECLLGIPVTARGQDSNTGGNGNT
jgi:hypothetical protein